MGKGKIPYFQQPIACGGFSKLIAKEKIIRQKGEIYARQKYKFNSFFFFIFIIQQTFALEFTLQVDIDGAIQLESFLR